MSRQTFDALDFKILEMLSNNARKPFLEIARETNVSGAAIHQRIQKLTASGVIRGFETIINPPSVGYETCAYIGFILNDPTKFDEVVERLKAIPEVVDCHFTTGHYDIFAKIFAIRNCALDLDVRRPSFHSKKCSSVPYPSSRAMTNDTRVTRYTNPDI